MRSGKIAIEGVAVVKTGMDKRGGDGGCCFVVNIHVEDTNDKFVIEINNILHSFRLFQHVRQPTHNLLSILNLFICDNYDDLDV